MKFSKNQNKDYRNINYCYLKKMLVCFSLGSAVIVWVSEAAMCPLYK